MRAPISNHTRHLLLCALALLVPAFAHAETKEQRMQSRHELRIGVADPFLARMGVMGSPPPYFTNQPYIPPGTSAEEAHSIMLNYRINDFDGYTLMPRFFVEYQYRINPYIGVGLKADVLPILGSTTIRNGYYEIVGHSGKYLSLLYLEFVPRVKFTFYHHEYVNLYAAAGFGLVADCPIQSIQWRFDAELQATLFGLSIGKNGLFGSFEFFNIGLTTLRVHMQPTNFLSASIGYRF